MRGVARADALDSGTARAGGRRDKCGDGVLWRHREFEAAALDAVRRTSFIPKGPGLKKCATDAKRLRWECLSKYSRVGNCAQRRPPVYMTSSRKMLETVTGSGLKRYICAWEVSLHVSRGYGL